MSAPRFENEGRDDPPSPHGLSVRATLALRTLPVLLTTMRANRGKPRCSVLDNARCCDSRWKHGTRSRFAKREGFLPWLGVELPKKRGGEICAATLCNLGQTRSGNAPTMTTSVPQRHRVVRHTVTFRVVIIRCGGLSPVCDRIWMPKGNSS